MGLKEIEATLPPGFRFYPKDEDLVCHYLYNKISNEKLLKDTMVEVNLHTCEPWQLPDAAKLGTNEWYFFSFRDCKYATGQRKNRATASGYWKATGKDKPVFDDNNKNIISLNSIVGMRKTLVFYCGRAPNGIKTNWVMHEYRLENFYISSKDDWVLCRVFYKGKEKELMMISNKLSTAENEFLNSAKLGDMCSPIKTSPSSSPSYNITVQTLAGGGYNQQVLTSFSQLTPQYYEDNKPSSSQDLAVLNKNPNSLFEVPDQEIIMYPRINEINSPNGEMGF